LPALRTIGEDELAQDIYVINGENLCKGFDAYRALATRIPILWPLVPLAYLGPVRSIGSRIYRRVADHRICEIDVADTPSARAYDVRTTKSRTRGIVVVGGFLFYAFCLAAVVKFDSWPMSIYPTFEDVDEARVVVLTIEVESASGAISEIQPITYPSEIAPERLMALFNRITAIEDRKEREKRLAAFWKLWLRENPGHEHVSSVRFYRDVLSSLPENRKRGPISREFLAQLK
jgi:hypothetical protein